MSKTFYYYYYILQFASVIPLTYGLMQYRKLDAILKIFMLYLSVSLMQTCVMTVLSLQKQNNLWIMNLSLPVNLGFLLWIYARWQWHSVLRNIFIGTIIGFTVVWVIDITLFEGLFGFTKVSRPMQGLVFTLASCALIYQLNKESDRPILELSQFWISSGLMLYYGGMLFVSLFSNVLYKTSADSLIAALSIQPALGLITHLFYTAGLRNQCLQQTFSGLSS